MSTATAPADSVPWNGIATRRDLAVNGLILGFAGAMWLGWAQDDPPAGWSLPLGIASALGLLVAVLAGVLTWRARRGASAMADPRGRRTYFRVLGVEAGAILVGATGLGIGGQTAQLAPWVLLVVGVHFVPLSSLFGIRSLAVAGGLLVVVSVAATIVGVVSTVAPSAVAGGVGGPVLIGFGAWSLLRHRQATR